MEPGEGPIDRGEVALHHLLALAAVALLDRVLDRSDCLLDGQHAGEREEARLEGRVHAAGEPRLAGDTLRVDDMEAELLARDLLLHVTGQVPPGVDTVRARQQERRAGTCVLEYVEALEQPELVTGDEVGLFDQVRRFDRVVAETQVRDGHRSRLLRVVDEIRLHVVARFAGDDLGRILVSAHRAIRAQPVEQTADALLGNAPSRVVGEARTGDVVVDTDREVPGG